MTTRPYWHIHHEILLEWNTEPIANRRRYIRKYKPAAEVPIRLRWLTPVKGELPATLVKARAAEAKARAAYAKALAAYNKARPACDKAGAAYDKAWAAYAKARAAARPAIEALHAKEHPGCPWDGRTLLP